MLITFIVLYGCDDEDEIQEVSVKQGAKEVYTIENQKDLETLKTIIENETWRKQNPNTQISYLDGPDYTFKLAEYNYEVRIQKRDKSIWVFRYSNDREVERAYIPFYEEAEKFFELITGNSFLKG
jgi:hypothetical protein